MSIPRNKVGTVIHNMLLFFFFISTPVVQYLVFILENDKDYYAIINGYAFSIPMVFLYIYPFLLFNKTFYERVKIATMNWIIWLSVFTEIVFQIPHNLFVKQLNDMKGSVIEWPFYSYGLSDSRWNNYHDGSGLAPEVWLINYNDAGLGVLVLLALIYYKTHKNTPSEERSKVLFVLIVIFRDATLWRETVEYMFDHHTRGYPYTTYNYEYRTHAIVILWFVNGVWLLAPIISVLWGLWEIESTVNKSQVKDSKML